MEATIQEDKEMCFVVSRFIKVNGVQTFAQDMAGPGSPFKTREEAEAHLEKVLSSFRQGMFGFYFEVREIPESDS